MKFFKKQASPKMPSMSIEPKVETAIVLCKYDNGGKTVGFIKVDGIEMLRPATMNDMYGMCQEVIKDLQAIAFADRFATRQANPLPPAPMPEPVAPTVEEEKPAKEYEIDRSHIQPKVEEKKDDIKADNTKVAEKPEHPA